MSSSNDELPDDYGTDPDRPWERPARGGDRPWTVTAAAVIAFVLVAVALIGVLTAIPLVLHWDPSMDHPVSRGFVYVGALLEVAFAGLMWWGGVNAWQGVTNKILFFAALALLASHVISAIVEGVRPAVVYPHV